MGATRHGKEMSDHERKPLICSRRSNHSGKILRDHPHQTKTDIISVFQAETKTLALSRKRR